MRPAACDARSISAAEPAQGRAELCADPGDAQRKTQEQSLLAARKNNREFFVDMLHVGFVVCPQG